MLFHPTQNVSQLSEIDTEGGVVDFFIIYCFKFYLEIMRLFKVNHPNLL